MNTRKGIPKRRRRTHTIVTVAKHSNCSPSSGSLRFSFFYALVSLSRLLLRFCFVRFAALLFCLCFSSLLLRFSSASASAFPFSILFCFLYALSPSRFMPSHAFFFFSFAFSLSRIILDAFTHYAKETKEKRFLVLIGAFEGITSTEDRVPKKKNKKRHTHFSLSFLSL